VTVFPNYANGFADGPFVKEFGGVVYQLGLDDVGTFRLTQFSAPDGTTHTGWMNVLDLAPTT
jgi:hypothetical protein